MSSYPAWGTLDDKVRYLKGLTAKLVKYENMPDVKCWENTEMSLTAFLDNIFGGKIEADNDFWVSSSEGQAALECMQAIVEHAPAAMRTAASSRQDQTNQVDILVVPYAVCRVLDVINEYAVNLLTAWPTGLQSATSALVEVAVLLPQMALTDTFVMPEIARTLAHLSTGSVVLTQKQKVDLVLVQV